MLRPNPIRLDHLRGDLAGGVTAAIVALPLALAFGVASGAGVTAGLYGAIAVGFVAAWFGGTPSQISGPTGPMTIVMASVISQFATSPGAAFTVVVMAGLLQVLFGRLRVGRYVNLLPYPVISGFLTGIGCILIIMQLDPLLGHPSAASVVNAISVLPGYLREPNVHALAVGVAAFAVCVALPRPLRRFLPSPLAAIVVATLLALWLDRAPLLDVPARLLPELHAPIIAWSALGDMLVAAAVLAALGSIDSLLTSLAADNATRTFHDSDKELVGQGLGNVAAGLLGGLPGAGATIRTLSNIQAGGRTPLAGMIHAAVLLLVGLGLGTAVAWIPQAALAGVLLKVGIDVIDWRFVRRLHLAPRIDAVLFAVVLALTVLVDIITAVGIGVVLASLAFVKQMAELQAHAIRAIGVEEGEKIFDPREAACFRRCAGQAMVLHLTGPMSFGAASEMVRRASVLEPQPVLIVDLVDVPSMDGSAALALEQILEQAHHEGRAVFVAGAGFRVVRVLSRLGVLDSLKETRRFATRLEALEAAAAHVEAGAPG